MNACKSLARLFAIAAVAAPIATFANVQWITTGDEAGWRIVTTPNAPVAAAKTTPVKIGDISPDRQYVFMGEETGWQLRAMEYRVTQGRLAHVDDPAGHMNREADSSPLSEAQRLARESSGG